MKSRLDKLFIYFIGYLYVLVMLFLASSVFSGQIPAAMLLLTATAVYFVINLLLLFRVSRIASCMVFGAVCTGAVALYLTGNGGFLADQVTPLARMLESVYYGQMLILSEQPPASVIMLVSLASALLSVLVHYLFNRCFRMFLLTGFVLAMHIGIWSLTGKENKTLLAFTMILTVLSYFRQVYERKARYGLLTGGMSAGRLMLFTLPAVILPVLIVISLPKSERPIRWPWLDRKAYEAYQYLEERFGRTDVEFFTLSATGFSGFANRLGGQVRPKNTVMMDVKGIKRTYLRGAAYSWYESNMWHQSTGDQQDITEIENTLLENRIGWLHIPVEKLFPEAEENDKELLQNLASGKAQPFLFPTYSIEVRPRGLSTKTVFAPLLTILPITSGEGGNLDVQQDSHGIAIAPEKLTRGSQYTVYYLQPMYGAPMLKRALAFSYDSLYQDALDEVVRHRRVLLARGASAQSPLLEELERKIEALTFLLARSKEIEEAYTQLSDDTPERVLNLARDLTTPCANDYEKVIAIEEYLKSNYEYTLSPSNVPEGRDFVDWFLFEDRRGYCTYYATSMVVLLRAAGIPARYVEGFVMPAKHQDNVYTITGRNAHAWVEVYFQGFGWLTFEPTPVYADVMQYLPSEDDIRKVGETPKDMEVLMNRYAQMYGRTSSDQPAAIRRETTANPLAAYARYLPMAIAVLLLAMLIIDRVTVLIETLIFLSLDDKRKVIRLYQTMIKWLESSGLALQPGETVLDFGRRVDNIYSLTPYTMSDASEIFCRARYGNKEITGEELGVVRSVSQKLRKVLLKNLGIRRLMPIRHILYRI
ncbi:DUF4129 domain-containing transglutaminase family protein [Thermoclostridium caenicola]|uniref:DUF4129 domain-containing transglutaminase family protein n=1 Tax=Thermoclostridium caenicola TaxID=659425 RepID=UPI00122D0EBE|nr:transglutaminase domain-containing protein [Thermoclostridium caenicola]